jgi:hypothetical protein
MRMARGVHASRRNRGLLRASGGLNQTGRCAFFGFLAAWGRSYHSQVAWSVMRGDKGVAN